LLLTYSAPLPAARQSPSRSGRSRRPGAPAISA